MSLILEGLSRTISIMRMILRLVACVVLIGACILVQVQESSGTTTEKWRCFDRFDYDKKTALVELTRVTKSGERSGFGEVSVAGVTYKALFEVEGLNRRWDFGEKPRTGSYSYAFVITPDGGGAYYDFSGVEPGGMTKSKQFFSCVSP